MALRLGDMEGRSIKGAEHELERWLEGGDSNNIGGQVEAQLTDGLGE